MKLTPQEKKVYEHIRNNPGCTSHDITMATYIQKPCARIVGLKKKGIEIEIVGEMRYPGSRPFKKYAIKNGITKQVESFTYDPVRGVMVRNINTITV